MTVRLIIATIRKEIREHPDLLPEKAAEYLNQLSSLIGNCNDEIREADMLYNKKLLECYGLESKANRAKILAETSDEYARRREARDTKEVAIELIRSLKYYLRAKGEEYQHTPRL